MDALVLGVAEEWGTTLVTLDNELASRAAGAVQVLPVSAFLHS